MALDNLRQDLRYTVRTLRRDAGFTTFAILIAGLGIGASATVFSVVNTLLLRPLPFAEPAPAGVDRATATPADCRGRRRRSGTCWICANARSRCRPSPATSRSTASATTCSAAAANRSGLSGVPVSDNFFDVLGVKPEIGRTFTKEECVWNGPKAVMLGHGLWQRRFNSDPRDRRARR